ncbi:MAG: M23 family metallopeptidase [Cyanobacteria bacterium J06581_3]
MKRRQFIKAAILSALGASAAKGAVKAGALKRGGRDGLGDIFTYLDRQITPSVAAQMAAQNVSDYGKLSEGDIFWSVMWPYMYTVGKAEGTVGNSLGLNPYNIIYTYDTFESYADHPRRAYPILDDYGQPTGEKSDAAGWPQFISTTWDEVVADNSFWYDGPAFQPANQDLGFLYLHRDSGGHAALMSGVRLDPVTQRLTIAYDAFAAAVEADSIRWASLPGANIGAATGQKTRPLWWLWTQFQWGLWQQMGYRRRIVHPIGTDKTLTSLMGYQAWRKGIHWGQDFESPVGTAIVAPEAGAVNLTGYEPKGGYYIRFVPSAQPELAVIFRHCQQESLVKLNTPVAAGELIGRTGNSGESTTGAHAHIEVTVDGHHINPHYYLGMASWF